mgnify:CR=1 FL=1
MSRCLAPTAVFAVAAALYLASASASQHRQFPQHALRGQLVFAQTPDVLLNGKPARLAPGARVFDVSNHLALPGALQGQKYIAHYTLDADQNLRDIWLLNPAELANVHWPSTPQQATSWTFNPGNQAWTKP